MEKFNYGGNKGALYDKTFYTFDALELAAQLTTLHVVEFMDININLLYNSLFSSLCNR